MRISLIVLSVINIIYLIVTFFINAPNNFYLSPYGITYYIGSILALLSVVILIANKSGEGIKKKLLLSSMTINIVSMFFVKIFF